MVLEVTGRWLPAVLSLVLLAGVSAFAAKSEGSGPVAKGNPQPEVELVSESVAALSLIDSGDGCVSLGAGRALSTSQASWLASPNPLGIIWTPLASRLIWLVVAACLLSYGQGWRSATPRLRQHDCPKGHARPLALAALSLSESQIPTCMCVCQQAMRKVNDKRDLNRAQPLAVPTRVLDGLESRPAPILRSPLAFSSLLEFAQLGRGPPPVS